MLDSPNNIRVIAILDGWITINYKDCFLSFNQTESCLFQPAGSKRVVNDTVENKSMEKI